jgi:PPOX class probable F420-dependent enzyme
MTGDDLDLIRRLGAASRWLAVVATTRRDGSVHASLVNAGVLDDPVTGQTAIALVVRGDARKLAHFRRSGRAVATFHQGWEWASVEGPVRIAGPDDPLDGLASEAIPGLLRDVFRAAGGVHDDWEEYDRVMAGQRRTAVLIHPARFVTNS